MTRSRVPVHLRVVVDGDAPWLVRIDRSSGGPLARPFEWDEGSLAERIAAGDWVTPEQWAWAVVVESRPVGFVLVHRVAAGERRMHIRLEPSARGRGVGREALRQLADHHFADDPELDRLVGRAHEHNIPMQRAFVAAGFRMVDREDGAYELADGSAAAAWTYALSRADWEADRHRPDATFRVGGRTFRVAEVLEGDGGAIAGVRFEVDQAGRRVWATYAGDRIVDGEMAGILQGDLMDCRFVQDVEAGERVDVVTGTGVGRLQHRADGHLEVVIDLETDGGRRIRASLVDDV